MIYFLFLNEVDVCNFVNDTTPSVCYKNLAELLEKLERNPELAIQLFEDSYMKLNTGKWHLLISGHKYKHQWAQLDKDMVCEENKVKLLRTTIDNE